MDMVQKAWQLEGDDYVPNIDSLHNFNTSSGIVHRFYDVVVNTHMMEVKRAAVLEKRPGKVYRKDPHQLPALFNKLNPFRSQPFPIALYIEPSSNADEVRWYY